MKIKLTIIIAAYNIEKWVGDCVDSFEKIKNNKEIEIIFINDGSTDKTLKIIDDKKHKNMKVLTKENGGLSSARNYGLKHANGTYIWFVDGDDMINTSHLSQVLNLIKKDKYDVICFDVTNYDDMTKTFSDEERWHKKINHSFKTQDILKYGFDYTPWSKIFKKEIFNDVEWPNIIHEDCFYVSTLFWNKELNFYKFDKSLYFYRVNRAGSIIAKSKQKNKEVIENILNFTKLNDEYKMQGSFLLASKLNKMNKKVEIESKNLIKEFLRKKEFYSFFKRKNTHKISFWLLKLRLFFLFKILLKIRGL